MKKTHCLLILTISFITSFATGFSGTTDFINLEQLKRPDSITGQIHPAIKHLFYDLPLEKSLEGLRKKMVNDQRFVSTDSTFNTNPPTSCFKGITTDIGLIKSTPDSIQVLLFPGNTSLATEKGGESDFKDILLVNFKYYFSSKDHVEMEYKQLINLLDPIVKDSFIERSESPYKTGDVHGQMIINGKVYESFNPYYRIGINSISMVPSNDAKSVFIIDIVFSTEHK
jgi:hypothetical protein